MRKILYISGTRADYGLMKRTLSSIKKHSELEVEIAVTGMHLMPEFGKTIKEIKKDKFKIHKVKAIYKHDNRESMAQFLGECILKLTKSIKKINPDFILVLGDRAEMLAATIVGTYLNIPIVHMHGGDVTSTVDEISRHAITKLSHIHLTATQKAAERIVKMGEDPWRVHPVGAPGLDALSKENLLAKDKMAKKYNLDLSKPLILVLQHPVTTELKNAATQIKQTMDAIKELECQSLIIYPNADAGGRKMIEVIERYRKYSFIQIHKNIVRQDYLSLMKIASAIVGNSSSGIIEAPYFNLTTVNIGSRQDGRERAGNILEVDYDKSKIKRAIKRAIDKKKFKQCLVKSKNPYIRRNTNGKIVKILARVKINSRLLQKRIIY